MSTGLHVARKLMHAPWHGRAEMRSPPVIVLTFSSSRQMDLPVSARTQTRFPMICIFSGDGPALLLESDESTEEEMAV